MPFAARIRRIAFWDQNPRVLPGNFCRFGRNGTAETIRERAAALPTCSCGKDFAWHFKRLVAR